MAEVFVGRSVPLVAVSLHRRERLVIERVVQRTASRNNVLNLELCIVAEQSTQRDRPTGIGANPVALLPEQIFLQVVAPGLKVGKLGYDSSCRLFP
jgi:hypothetical protein